MELLLKAIISDDTAKAAALLAAKPQLAKQLVKESRLYEDRIFHWLYEGDTALHLAAAGYRCEIATLLLAAGADVNSRENVRHSAPIHYAADGFVNAISWDPGKQVAMLQLLIAAGANIHAKDKNGATPLHRAVRTRCASAVKLLLDAGSDPAAKNKSGSTPFHLAVQDTGRGGVDAAVAREAQRKIIQEFILRGVSTELLDSKGKSVFDAASKAVRPLLG